MLENGKAIAVIVPTIDRFELDTSYINSQDPYSRRTFQSIIIRNMGMWREKEPAVAHIIKFSWKELQ